MPGNFAMTLDFLWNSGESLSISPRSICLFMASARVTASCQVECQLYKKGYIEKIKSNLILLVHMWVVNKLAISFSVSGIE